MVHREPLDNLTLDVLDAQRAGMSYGKYKALHPNTMAANEPRLAQDQEDQESKPKKKRPAVYEFICLNCGQKFAASNAQAKYCSCACKARKNEELARRRRGIPERKRKK